MFYSPRVREASASDLAASLCGEVAAQMMDRDESSCVLGARLLVGVLKQVGIEATAIGVSLTIIRKDVVQLFIGDPDCRNENPDSLSPPKKIDQLGGFPGHVVVLARTEGRVLLLDPTAFQAIPILNELRLARCPSPAPWIAHPVGDRQTLTLDADASTVRDGWTYDYSPAPHLDWLSTTEWLDHKPSLLVEESLGKAASLLEEKFRKRSTNRNEPCPCGSGNKYKRCHGR